MSFLDMGSDEEEYATCMSVAERHALMKSWHTTLLDKEEEMLHRFRTQRNLLLLEEIERATFQITDAEVRVYGLRRSARIRER